jgi:hypothetical protein
MSSFDHDASATINNALQPVATAILAGPASTQGPFGLIEPLGGVCIGYFDDTTL